MKSSGVSSAAVAVARDTTLVTPKPSANSSRSSKGDNNRGVNPDACSALHGALPRDPTTHQLKEPERGARLIQRECELRVQLKRGGVRLSSTCDAALQGKAPGVQVMQNAGNPGNGISIRVRGPASINAAIGRRGEILQKRSKRRRRS
jgi:hypothetical protein